MPTHQLIEAVGKLGAVGALLVVTGLFAYAIAKGGVVIRDAILTVDRARSDDLAATIEHRKAVQDQVRAMQAEIAAGLRENTAAVNRLSETVNRLAARVEPHGPPHP